MLYLGRRRYIDYSDSVHSPLEPLYKIVALKGSPNVLNQNKMYSLYEKTTISGDFLYNLYIVYFDTALLLS